VNSKLCRIRTNLAFALQNKKDLMALDRMDRLLWRYFGKDNYKDLCSFFARFPTDKVAVSSKLHRTRMSLDTERKCKKYSTALDRMDKAVWVVSWLLS
jgi:hypothetical protein